MLTVLLLLSVLPNVLAGLWGDAPSGMGQLVGSTAYIQLPGVNVFRRIVKNEKGREIEHIYRRCNEKNPDKCGYWENVKTRNKVESGPTTWSSQSGALVIQDFRKTDAGTYMTGNRKIRIHTWVRTGRTDSVGQTSTMYLPVSKTFLREVSDSNGQKVEQLYRACDGENQKTCGYWEDTQVAMNICMLMGDCIYEENLSKRNIKTKKKVESGTTTYDAKKELMIIKSVQKSDKGVYMTADKKNTFTLDVIGGY